MTAPIKLPLPAIIDRLRSVNAELVAALQSCQREMAYAGWGGEGKQGALVVRINTLKLARAAIAKATS